MTHHRAEQVIRIADLGHAEEADKEKGEILVGGNRALPV